MYDTYVLAVSEELVVNHEKYAYYMSNEAEPLYQEFSMIVLLFITTWFIRCVIWSLRIHFTLQLC